MAEYIEREAALQIIDNYSKATTDEGKVVCEAIKDIVGIICPAADVVEVVRCKDCRRYVEANALFASYCTKGLRNILVKPDDFCSYGERKEQ